MGVLPPPYLVALGVVAGHDIEVAVAVDVMERAAGFQLYDFAVDDVAGPAVDRAFVPQHRRAGRPARTDDEIVLAVLIDIEDEGQHLLIAG